MIIQKFIQKESKGDARREPNLNNRNAKIWHSLKIAAVDRIVKAFN